MEAATLLLLLLLSGEVICLSLRRDKQMPDSRLCRIRNIPHVQELWQPRSQLYMVWHLLLRLRRYILLLQHLLLQRDLLLLHLRLLLFTRPRRGIRGPVALRRPSQ